MDQLYASWSSTYCQPEKGSVPEDEAKAPSGSPPSSFAPSPHGVAVPPPQTIPIRNVCSNILKRPAFSSSHANGSSHGCR